MLEIKIMVKAKTPALQIALTVKNKKLNMTEMLVSKIIIDVIKKQIDTMAEQNGHAFLFEGKDAETIIKKMFSEDEA